MTTETGSTPAAWDAGGPLTQIGKRIAGVLRIMPTRLRLRASVWQGSRVELWVGDSHAMSFNRRIVFGMEMVGPEGQVILRAGTRLMRSFARDGFGAGVERRIARTARRARPGQVLPFFVAGEIDVRAHLADHPDGDFAFVGSFVDRCRALAEELAAPAAYLVVPPPPGASPREDYPLVGSAADRLAAFSRLRDALVSEVDARPDAVLIDATDLLAGPDGLIRPELTDDGCHTNLRGVALVRSRVRALVG